VRRIFAARGSLISIHAYLVNAGLSVKEPRARRGGASASRA
jgi:hypothetical protein